MPIPVECRDCDAELTVPDNLAGKLVKCPHCSGPVRVPIDEPAPRPRRKSRPPTRRRKPKNTAGIVVGAAVVVAVIVAAAVGATLLARGGKKDAPPDAAQKVPDAQGNPGGVLPGTPALPGNAAVPVPVGPIRPPLPPGWVDFRHPKGEYSVYLPRKPSPAPVKPDMREFKPEGYYTQPTTLERPELICIIESLVYPPQVMEGYRTANLDLSVVERMFPGMKVTSNRITWLGRPTIDAAFESDLGGMMAGLPGGATFAKQVGPGGLKMPNGIPTKNTVYYRTLVVNDRVYTFAIQNIYGPPTEAERRAFFDSVVLGR